MGRTVDLDLFCPPLNCQFDFRDLAHLEDYMTESVSGLHNDFQNVNESKDRTKSNSEQGF